MMLNKTHIGKLFDNGGDGSWVYQLVAVSRTYLLFYDFNGNYIKEKRGKWNDWQEFEPTNPWPVLWLKSGWHTAKED